MTIAAALTEIARRAPSAMNVAQAHKVDGQFVDVGFADDHLFVIELPAGVLRAVVEAVKEHKWESV